MIGGRAAGHVSNVNCGVDGVHHDRGHCFFFLGKKDRYSRVITSNAKNAMMVRCVG
jgi:hypothetical protein